MYIILFLILLLLLYNFKYIDNFINSSDKLEIYLISLEKDISRRNLLYKQIQPDFYYAINGKDIDNNGISNLTRGEIGCYLSHMYMLKKVLTAKSDIVLILEDDAKLILNTETTENILEISKNAPTDWELIFLSYNYYEPTEPTNEKYKKITKIHGTQSYIVNKKNINIEKINKLLPIVEPIDITFPKKFKSYIYFPKIFDLSEYGNFSNTQNIQ